MWSLNSAWVSASNREVLDDVVAARLERVDDGYELKLSDEVTECVSALRDQRAKDAPILDCMELELFKMEKLDLGRPAEVLSFVD